MTDLERELEYELHRVLDPISRMPIPARRLPAQAGSIQRLLGGAGAALALKLATGVVAAAAAVTVAGAATTGSVNPQVWGQQVSEKVEACKTALGSGAHGIGDCVSDFAQTHGPQVSGQHGQGGGQGNPNSHGQNQGNANGHGNGTGAGSATGHAGGSTNPPGKAGKTPGPPPHSPAPGG